MKQSIIPSGFARISGALALAVALESVPSDALAFNIVGDIAAKRFLNGEKTVLSFTQSGSLIVTGSGTIELLVVGGGGGGGELGPVSDNTGIKIAGGGGAGGLVHKESFAVSAGTYTVTVGAGGAIGVNGGNSSVFSVTAYGGGYGARGGSGERKGGDGGSGGGANSGWTAHVDGGSAIHGDEDNLGHDGTGTASRFCPGGGGGAGSSPTKKVKRNTSTVVDIDDTSGDGVAFGGDGLAFDITGSEVYYAGGGAAYMSYGTGIASGGLGGGGNGNQAGINGLGGGGGGGKAGGSGCVILSFIPDEALPENSSDFALSGGTVLSTPRGIAHKFTTDGTLTVTGSGIIELLLVGGGGGGGELGPVSDQQGIKVAGGGGAGGLVYREVVAVSTGTYAVTVGAGGAIGANGGNSSIFSITAYGGGYGARGGTGERKGGDGGSGGGANSGWSVRVDGGSAIYGAEDNLGHDGSQAENRFCQGGGGGAGSSPTKKMQRNTSTILDIDDTSADGVSFGGDGLAFDISGVTTYYAGGGAAYMSYGTGIASGGLGGGGNGNQAGTDGLGGGGGGGKAGGSGVVIVRYMPKTKTGTYTAEGGTLTRKDGYHIHKFTSNGTFTLQQTVRCDVLLVGGGGGGGVPDVGDRPTAGGGGAGGFLYLTNVVIGAGTHTITVGAGGAIGANGGASAIDADSTFTGGIVAFGGGHGAAGNASTGNVGADGASGGGATHKWNDADVAEYSRAGGKAIYTSSGNAGHDGGGSERYYGPGGGGGAGTSTTPNTRNPGNLSAPTGGGDGLACSITGEEVWYAGGGAGYSMNDWYNGARGGKGGGGDRIAGAVANTGGGGCGNAVGASGIVVIRFLSSSPTVITFR